MKIKMNLDISPGRRTHITGINNKLLVTKTKSTVSSYLHPEGNDCKFFFRRIPKHQMQLKEKRDISEKKKKKTNKQKKQEKLVTNNNNSFI